MALPRVGRPPCALLLCICEPRWAGSAAPHQPCRTQPGGAATPNSRAEPRGSPVAETLLLSWCQQGCSLPQSWSGNSLHGWGTLAEGTIWRLGENQTSLQPHGDMNFPQLQIPVHSATLFSPAGNGPESEQPSVTVPAGQQNSYRLALPQLRYPRTDACSGQSSHGAKPEEGGLYPDHPQHGTRCKGWHMSPPFSPYTATELPCMAPTWDQRGTSARQAQAHLPLRRQKGSSGTGTRMVLKMGR